MAPARSQKSSTNASQTMPAISRMRPAVDAPLTAMSLALARIRKPAMMRRIGMSTGFSLQLTCMLLPYQVLARPWLGCGVSLELELLSGTKECVKHSSRDEAHELERQLHRRRHESRIRWNQSSGHSQVHVTP